MKSYLLLLLIYTTTSLVACATYVMTSANVLIIIRGEFWAQHPRPHQPFNVTLYVSDSLLPIDSAYRAHPGFPCRQDGSFHVW